MNEREIFEKAVEILEPVAREQFLLRACCGNQELQARIGALLLSDKGGSRFLQESIPEQLCAPEIMSTIQLPPGSIASQKSVCDDEDETSPDLSFLAPSTHPDSIGKIGHYEILKVLGQGGFGIVFKAFDEKLHRVVAIKAMNMQMAVNSPPRKRFLREARAAASIKNENIVQVYSVEEQPLPYLVMEYIDGYTLQEKLNSNGPLEIAEVLSLGQQIASGLAAAHALRLIHRDIKPGNILIEGDVVQKVKITDFGLARAAEDASLTRSGMISGTPMYMAPEQALGLSLDHRTDLFSLGCVLYQMACGRPPFRAPTIVAVLKRVVDDTPRAMQEIVAEIPDWLVVIINKLLAKNPDERFQSSQEVADLLGRCQSELQLYGAVTCVTPKASSRGANATLKRTLILIGSLLATAAIIFVVLNSRYTNPNLASGIRQSAGISSPTSEISNSESQNSGSSTGWHGWPTDAPPPAIAPFNSEQAKKHQDAWAKYLGVPVEYTNSLNMKFRLVPPGEFTMGCRQDVLEQLLIEASKADQPQWFLDNIKDEAPAHLVRITKPTYVAIYETTVAQFRSFVSDCNYVPDSERDGKGGQFFEQGELRFVRELSWESPVRGHKAVEDEPVRQISWNDVTEFGLWLTKKDEIDCRLLSEAEWEYVCRAGTVTLFSTGDSLTKSQARIDSMVPSAVGRFAPNPWGLFDLHGNVAEWCIDQIAKNYAELPIDNPVDDRIGRVRVLRGGAMSLQARAARSSSRRGLDRQMRTDSVGFRVCIEVKKAPSWPNLRF